MIYLIYYFQHAEERLRIALEEHNVSYPVFKGMLDKCHILLDKKVLWQLAMYEPRTFKVFSIA